MRFGGHLTIAGDSKRSRFDLAWLKPDHSYWHWSLSLRSIWVAVIAMLDVRAPRRRRWRSSRRAATHPAGHRRSRPARLCMLPARKCHRPVPNARPRRYRATITTPQWVNRRISGVGLETFFDYDLVIVIDGADDVMVYSHRTAGVTGEMPNMPICRSALVAADRNLLRATARTRCGPGNARLPVVATQDTGKRRAAPPRWIEQRFQGQAGHRHGRDSDRHRQRACRRRGHEGAPLVFVGEVHRRAALLQTIGDRLQTVRPARTPQRTSTIRPTSACHRDHRRCSGGAYHARWPGIRANAAGRRQGRRQRAAVHRSCDRSALRCFSAP